MKVTFDGITLEKKKVESNYKLSLLEVTFFLDLITASKNNHCTYSKLSVERFSSDLLPSTCFNPSDIIVSYFYSGSKGWCSDFIIESNKFIIKNVNSFDLLRRLTLEVIIGHLHVLKVFIENLPPPYCQNVKCSSYNQFNIGNYIRNGSTFYCPTCGKEFTKKINVIFKNSYYKDDFILSFLTMYAKGSKVSKACRKFKISRKLARRFFKLALSNSLEVSKALQSFYSVDQKQLTRLWLLIL